MAHIALDPAQQPLIDAAIQLGDWLLSLDKLRDSDIAAIKAVQQKLRHLPELTDGTLAMYGFSIETALGDARLVRGWDISLEYMAEDPDQQGGLEMFSTYLPVPETTDPTLLAEKKRQEQYFQWPVGGVCCFISPGQAQKWLKELAQPLVSVDKGDSLRVEIVFQQYYSEIDYPLN